MDGVLLAMRERETNRTGMYVLRRDALRKEANVTSMRDKHTRSA